MAIYYVELATSVVDGSQYNSNDIIVIRAGKRGNLTFKNFNGNGNYISIINENILSKVEITGSLRLIDCKYVDLRGNNSMMEYGFKIINTGNPVNTNTLRVMGQSNHIKLSYTEEAFYGNTKTSGIGIFVQDAGESSSWVYDTIEIHHNYIHESRYSGMYIGQNYPHSYDNPYIANISIHDNIMENSGSYGMCLKGVHSTSGVCSIYNNIIKNTGLVFEDEDNSFHQGISLGNFYGSTYANVYNNTITKTKGQGIKVLGFENRTNPHQIFNNKILGCGGGDGEINGNGISLQMFCNSVDIYDNIIIQPKRYGIWAQNSTIDSIDSRNLIGDAGLGERYVQDGGGMTEGTGADANIYHADVADFGFNTWSDDGDYSNDDFTIGDPCEGVVCDNVCIGLDLWSRKCVEGDCIPDQLLESNSVTCGYDPCAGVVCDNICIGIDLWSQKCVEGDCIPDQLLESNSSACDYDPCEGIVCSNICIGKDLWSQICVEGDCIPDQLLESNSVTCELCEGVVCGNTCVGDDLWSQSCDPDTGNCVPNQLIQLDSINCKIPDQVPSDESTIKTYIILGGFGLLGLTMLMLSKKR